jgi:hypothetical protein
MPSSFKWHAEAINPGYENSRTLTGRTLFFVFHLGELALKDSSQLRDSLEAEQALGNKENGSRVWDVPHQLLADRETLFVSTKR